MANSRPFSLQDELTRVAEAVDQVQKYGTQAEKAAKLPAGSAPVFDRIRLNAISNDLKKQLTELAEVTAIVYEKAALLPDVDLTAAIEQLKTATAERDELAQSLATADETNRYITAARDKALQDCKTLRNHNELLLQNQQSLEDTVASLQNEISRFQNQQMHSGQTLSMDALNSAKANTPERHPSLSGPQRRPSTDTPDLEPASKRRSSRQGLPMSISAVSQLSVQEEDERAGDEPPVGTSAGPPYPIVTSMDRLVKSSALSEADFQSFKPQLEEQLQAKPEKHQAATLRQCGNLSPSNNYCFLAKLNKAPNTIKPRKALERCEFCTRRDLKCCWLVAQEDGKLEVHLRS